MDATAAPALFEALASAPRLQIYRLLVRAGADGLVAGELSETLDIPSSNLSFHLKTLIHAGLVGVEQEGRFKRHRANISLMLELIAYLTEECCAGQPDRCADLRAASSCSEAVLPPLPTAGKPNSDQGQK